VIFYATTGTVIGGNRLWPAGTKTWPTYVTLIAAVINAVLSSLVLIGYCWGTKIANRWNTVRTVFSIGIIIFDVVLWAIAAGSLQSSSTFDGDKSSLWAATCGIPQDQQEPFKQKLDFGKFCIKQVIALYTVLC
jgi:hypothetical protein